jgi:hypothetical protein
MKGMVFDPSTGKHENFSRILKISQETSDKLWWNRKMGFHQKWRVRNVRKKWDPRNTQTFRVLHQPKKNEATTFRRQHPPTQLACATIAQGWQCLTVSHVSSCNNPQLRPISCHMLMDLELSSFRNYLFNHSVIIFIWALPENMGILTNNVCTRLVSWYPIVTNFLLLIQSHANCWGGTLLGDFFFQFFFFIFFQML